jgi:outer membrane protein TolC
MRSWQLRIKRMTNLELIALEEKKRSYSQTKFKYTLDKFRIGTITTLEFRTAQLNYVNAKVRYSNAQFRENYLKLHFASWQEILILIYFC